MTLASPVVQLNQASCLQITYATKATLKIYLGYFTSSDQYQEQEIYLRHPDLPHVFETEYLTIVPPLDAGSPDSIFKIKLERDYGGSYEVLDNNKPNSAITCTLSRRYDRKQLCVCNMVFLHSLALYSK